MLPEQRTGFPQIKVLKHRIFVRHSRGIQFTQLREVNGGLTYKLTPGNHDIEHGTYVHSLWGSHGGGPPAKSEVFYN